MRFIQDPRSQPTVGDTLTVVHRVSVPVGALVQPRGPVDSLVATLVGAPLVEREGDSVRIAYTLAVWLPGEHDLRLPGAIVLIPGGTVDTLGDATVHLSVQSVLPRGVAPESLTAREPEPWIPRTERSAWPFLALLLPLVLTFGLIAWLWRRPGSVRPLASSPSQPPTQQYDRIARWLGDGEVELALDHLMPLIPDSESGRSWLASVNEVRFATDVRDLLTELGHRGLELARHSALDAP